MPLTISDERTAFRPAILASIAMLALTLAACGSSDSGRAGAKGRGTPTVGYVVVQPTNVPIVVDLPGRTSAFESSDVRPQVNGIIRRRLFVEGSVVQRGQPLYEIDPRLYRAAANQARANLDSAQANAEATRAQAERYKPLAAIEAVSKQDYTNAVASARQAGASVEQQRAALDTARINLNFTTVPAPITGRIGRSLFTVGALVSASQADPLTQIQLLDPIFVDIQQSAADLVTLRRSLAKGGAVPTDAVVRLSLDDGSDYGTTGTIKFTEALVDTATGTVTLRARFPNPQGLLLPGMFVRASFAQALDTRAFLVPQQAVMRDPRGNATIFVVGAGDRVAQKSIETKRTQGQYWIVTKGVAAGDRIITQGLSKIKDKQQVKAVPADTPQKIVAPKGTDGKQAPGSQAKSG